MKIRIATPEDASAIQSIYRYYVEHTAITFELEVPSVEEFQGRIKKTLERYPYLRPAAFHRHHPAVWLHR